jgi:hypothetical protein
MRATPALPIMSLFVIFFAIALRQMRFAHGVDGAKASELGDGT